MKTLFTIQLIEEDDGELMFSCDPDPTGADMDLILRAIGRTRCQVAPPISEQPPPAGTELDLGITPLKWYAGDSFPNGKVMGLRHPMFGWLAFHVPPTFADDLQKALQLIDSGPPARH